LVKRWLCQKGELTAWRSYLSYFQGQDIFIDVRKNILISDINRWIGFLSPPEEGKKRDCGMFKHLFPPKIFPKSITLWLDLGFTGVNKAYPNASIMMPKKKPRVKELTDEEKARNKVISSIRVRIEHVIP
jgi:hypothetical protein